MNDYLVIHKDDNVAVALGALQAGLTDGAVMATEDVPPNFKFALRDIACGADVIKYGSTIGTATCFIPKGAVVHSHNLKTKLGALAHYKIDLAPRHTNPTHEKFSFHGYRRENGKVGIRNDIFIIPTVGCVNALCERIARETTAQTGFQDVFVLAHPYGCSQLGEDQASTQKILAALASHPNAGGVLIVSLGCENNNLEVFAPLLEKSERIRFLVAQDSDDELADGVSIASSLVDSCRAELRTEIDASELVIGLKCGGSDALSGITANPLVGKIADRMASIGGSAILTEVPEMFGAEELLMVRSQSQEICDDIAALINNFKKYYIDHGEPVGENPSPGNKDGGITTLEEKSLGCVQKGGQASIADVIAYGDFVKKKGLTLLNAPGNDIVAQTALAAAGAHIILFTTGRGTPIGAAVPTIKISSNTALAQKKPEWIDFDAGTLLQGQDNDAVAAQFLDLILETASGKLTKNEVNGYRDIAIWKNGVTL